MKNGLSFTKYRAKNFSLIFGYFYELEKLLNKYITNSRMGSRCEQALDYDEGTMWHPSNLENIVYFNVTLHHRVKIKYFRILQLNWSLGYIKKIR